MKNRTLFKQEYIDAAMRASNFDNNKYKIFKMIYNIFGLLFGMVLACGLICVRYMTDTTLKTEDDLKRYLDIPVLSVVPYYEEKKE